ncbi:MAG TPA: hypothetical protein PK239_00650 [Chitinophagales bacterium]|nr:hypothetical protein [Chitinophagales bacterium]HRK25771.1 hypothetical protein [Chitinophagales bacterium]
MDGLHLHLLLNHFPIIGSLLAFLVLLYGLVTKSNEVKRVACLLLVGLTIITLPVMKTGEIAEEKVENLAGFNEQSIHQHEEAAEIALWVMIAAGVAALVSVLASFYKPPLFTLLTMVTLLLNGVAFGFMAQAGNIGGKIRHTELTNTNAQQQPAQQNQNHDDHNHDHDH